MHRIISVLLFLVFLSVFAVCMSPYMDLEPGSFLGAVFIPLHQILCRYAGFFQSGPYVEFTLLPLVVFLLRTAIDFSFRVKFRTWLLELLMFCGLYVICFHFCGPQGYYLALLIPSNLAAYALHAGLGLFGLGFLICVILMISGLRRACAARRERKAEKETENTEPQTPEDRYAEIDRLAQSMSFEQARAALTSLEMPVFTNYRNVTPEDIQSEQGTSVNRTVYGAAFEDGNLHRAAMEDPGRQDNTVKKTEEAFPTFDLDSGLEIQSQIQSQIQSPAEPKPQVVYVQQPAPQPQVIYVQAPPQPQVVYVQQPAQQAAQQPVRVQPVQVPETTDAEKFSEKAVPSKELREGEAIFDEGSDGDEDLESAHARYRLMKKQEEDKTGLQKEEDSDFVSGVGGLKRSAEGYLYNPAKFIWRFPPESYLKPYTSSTAGTIDSGSEADGQIIVETLRQFRIETTLKDIMRGPTFTLYELILAKGIRINAVVNLADNIALELAVPSVRILAPIPGKSAIGVEVPNKNRDTIGFLAMMPALKRRTLKIPMVLGKTITGDSIIIDLAGAPHLLIAGTTGSGKSVCVNSLICSVLYTKTPREVRMLLVDPKMVELSMYNNIGHLLTPVITDPKKAIKAMAYCVHEMERRMSMFSRLGVRKIEEYNEKVKEKNMLREPLPYIMVIVDEFADLMMVVGKELESYIKRITAVARFTGIHLVLATQRPSADVITGIIKSNMPSQIAFAVSNQVNSRIILDTVGAEKLLGRGDMLYSSASNPAAQRIQGAFIDTDEIEKIVEFVKSQGAPDYIDESYFEDEEESEDEVSDLSSGAAGSEDLFMRAWRLVAEKGEASASYLQRRLSIGYNRAANLIEQMEDQGIVGPARGSKPREIIKFPDSQ